MWVCLCTCACVRTSIHVPHSVVYPQGTYITDEVGNVRWAGRKRSMWLWHVAEGGIPAQGWPTQRAAGDSWVHWVAQLVYIISVL